MCWQLTVATAFGSTCSPLRFSCDACQLCLKLCHFFSESALSTVLRPSRPSHSHIANSKRISISCVEEMFFGCAHGGVMPFVLLVSCWCVARRIAVEVLRDSGNEVPLNPPIVIGIMHFVVYTVTSAIRTKRVITALCWWPSWCSVLVFKFV